MEGHGPVVFLVKRPWIRAKRGTKLRELVHDRLIPREILVFRPQDTRGPLNGCAHVVAQDIEHRLRDAAVLEAIHGAEKGFTGAAQL